MARVMDDDVKAIITVPVLGNPCDMERIMDFAGKHDVYVIEDIAQSYGAKNNGQFAGTIGHMGVVSFQMNKILTAGEGGGPHPYPGILRACRALSRSRLLQGQRSLLPGDLLMKPVLLPDRTTE